MTENKIYEYKAVAVLESGKEYKYPISQCVSADDLINIIRQHNSYWDNLKNIKSIKIYRKPVLPEWELHRTIDAKELER